LNPQIVLILILSIDVTDMNTLTRKETKAFYDRFGSKQDKQAFYEDPAIRVLIGHAHFDKAEAVVEFGCGTGRFAKCLLADHLSKKATYWGCDLSKTMVALTENRIRPYGERAKVVEMDGGLGFPQADASADRFLSNYVLDILSEDDIHLVLNEAHRILRKDGLACLVSITSGTHWFSKLVMGVWRWAHALRPTLVGGCRPIELSQYLISYEWDITLQSIVAAFGIASEVIVARKRGTIG
jgi:ubiquinone/menaquinone biosynthesis C-methylase UbiE